MKKLLLTSAAILITFSALAEDTIDIKVTQTENKRVKAEILNFNSGNANYDKIKDVKLIGSLKNTEKDKVNINWEEVELDNKKASIPRPFASKVQISGKLEPSDSFSAKGNYSDLVSAIEDLLQNQPTVNNNTSRNSSGTSDSSYVSSYPGTSSLSSYANDGYLTNTANSAAEKGDIITTSEGCSPYVDYELNMVYIQQRMIQDGAELDSCSNSSKSFILKKDYEACPDKETESGKEVYFQYYYIDDTNNLNQRYDVGQCVIDDVLSTSSSQSVTTTTGCSPYIDYELNQVFIQQRILQNGSVVQSCHNSDVSFTLQKDYDICPDKQDLPSRTNNVYFQYYYIDNRNDIEKRNNIGECVIDSSKSGALEVSRNYDNCSNYADLSTMTLYKQYEEYYTDSGGNKLLLTECQKDYDKSFKLVEDFSKCAIKHYFDKGYSIAQKEIGYNDSNNEYVKLYDCFEDDDYKYEHNITSNGCTSNQSQLFVRKYITIDNIPQYISDCEPVDSDSEICTSNPFTHDFEAGVSYYNKTWFYYNNNQKITVLDCVKSSATSFEHNKETSVCDPADNDNTKQTTYYSKTYITVNGQREYISDCEPEATAIAYKNTGYTWLNEFTYANTAITVANSGDNTYLGSLQGQEVNRSVCSSYYTDSWATCLANQYDISSYSTSGKCTGWTSPSYNGLAIDTNYSDRASVTFNNYVSQVSSSPMCYNSCRWVRNAANGTYTCYDQKSRKCESGNNTLYYQRCTNYQCSLTKTVKYPIYARSDGTNYTDKSTALEVKYICGNSSVLNGQEVFY